MNIPWWGRRGFLHILAACVWATNFFAVRPIDAAIVVDPLSTGATDVGFTYTVPSNVLTNPVPDPLIAPPGGGGNGLLIVGHSSNGAMTIDGGSQATITQIWMGHAAGTRGSLTVAGANSKLSDPVEIRVGLAGTGSLKVLDGGLVESEQVYVGSGVAGVPSEVIVDGASTKLLLDDGLFVGGSKLSTVTTSNGAHMEANRVDIGFYSGTLDAVNRASVNTGAKWKVAGDLDVGTNGGGLLTIASGGEVEAFRTTLGSYSFPASPSLQLDGGMLRTTELYFPADGIAGSGSIFTKGLVADLDVSFDAAHGLVQTIPIPGQAGASLHLDHSDPSVLGAGYSENGTLTIADGRQIHSDFGYLGYFTGSHGTANVTGAGSKWSISGDLEVGRGGMGVLNIGTGATVEVAGLLQINQMINGETSHVMLNGGELYINVLAAAPSQIRGQGIVHAHGIHLDSSLVFDQPGVFGGEFQVPGQQVSIDFNEPVLSVLGTGFYGNGSIEIRNGAEVRSNEGLLGKEFNSHGTAVVEGAGSTWQLQSGELKLGGTSGNARGTLRVLNGGTVEAGLMRLSHASEVEVAGNGALLKSTSLRIDGYGQYGIPRIHIHSGGAASFLDSQTNGGNELTGRITIEGSASRLHFAYSANLNGVLLRISDGGILELGQESQPGQSALGLRGGMLHLDGGTVDVHGGTVDLENGQLLFESGVLRNFWRFEGNLSQTAGRVELGTQVAVIDGTYYQDDDAALSLILSNSSQPRLFVNRSALLEGTLEVDLPPAPHNINLVTGNSFELLYAEYGILGEFQNYVLPQLPAGMSWSLAQSERELNLVIVAGDFNADGQVDAADYTVWRDSLDTQVTAGSGADGDGDGWVTMNDYYLWKEYFGRKTIASPANIGGGGANSHAVPEPASIFMVLSGLLSALARRRRQMPVLGWLTVGR